LHRKLSPPALRVKLVILEVLDHGLPGIYKLAVEVLARLAVIIKIANGDPSTVLVLAGLVVQI
jgi:hypothetical protein